MESIIAGLINLGIFGGIVLIGIISFILARRSRKVYICDSCNEVFQFEQMSAHTCSVCGGKLIEIRAKDLKFFRNNKAKKID